MATMPVYICPEHCDNDNIQAGPPPSLWVSLTDFDLNGVMKALAMPSSKPWPILLLCLFAPVFCCALFAKKLLTTIKGGTVIKRRETMVHFKLQSKKSVVAIYKELENILPMLARPYGHLNMAANYDTRVISVLVDPSKCKHSFQILDFIRDLLSPESIKKQLTANGTRQNQAVEVTVSNPKCPRKHASNNVQLAAPKLGHLENNSGELILRFDSSVGNERVLSELNARKDEIKKVLKGFELDLTSIKKGSVVIKFHLQHGSKTFDTLTLDGEIDKLADQLLSNESFGRFRRETPTLSIQFIVKGNLQHATAVYADNLHVQMGERNSVYTCAHAHTPLDTNESADGPIQRTEATDRQECVAKFVKINILTLSPLPEQPASSAPKKSSDPVKIEVASQDGNVIKLLREEWSNVKSLLEKQYPGCHMKSLERKIIWELPGRGWKDSDVKSFVGDIFAIKRINNAIRTKSVCVDIHIPEWLAEKSVKRRLVKMLSKLLLLRFVFCTRSMIMCSCTVAVCASVYLAKLSLYPL
ncbi:uncharacterized protein [Littorina saxatilis]|uniref:uncharacterized protein n=1 Tax=Littorina saxatilis TaxID=31220 RepID=UPI0038B5335C